MVPEYLSLEYLAGFFDGEGCIGIYRDISRRKGREYHGYVLTVSLGQVDPAIVTYLKRHYGGHLRFDERSKKIKNRQDAYYWSISGKKAAEFLRELLPHLIGKKDQAELALEFQDQRLGVGQKHGSNPGHKEREASYSQRLKNLKKVGASLH